MERAAPSSHDTTGRRGGPGSGGCGGGDHRGQGIAYPTVPRGQARLRTIVGAHHTREQLALALDAIAEVGRKLGIA
ncbi:MAG: hypothetical protein ACJ789_10915 [Thermomicrobiales bacterium]